MTSPDSLGLRGKQDPAENSNPDFQAGFAAGRTADLPYDLVTLRRRRIKDPFGEKLLPKSFQIIEDQERASAQRRLSGYIAGLGLFMTEHGFPQDPVAIIKPEILTSPDALYRYLAGLRRDLPKPQFEKERISLPFERKRYKEIDLEFGSAYMLGFAVSVARDYGITPEWGEVPTDVISFTDFTQGEQGKTRPMPLDILDTWWGEEKLSLYEYDERRREKAYGLGLKVWLRKQGVEDVEARSIIDPKALQAFRAALDGKELLHPDVRAILGTSEAPATSDTHRFRSEGTWDDKSFMKKNRDKEMIYSSTNRLDDLIEPGRLSAADRLRSQVVRERIMETASQQRAFRAFGLGRVARQQRLARERAASNQSTPPQK